MLPNEPSFVNPNTSSAGWKSTLMVTVALARVALSLSVTVIPLSMATGEPPSIKEGAEPEADSTGAALTPLTVIPLPAESEMSPPVIGPFQLSAAARL
ncbi:hypothetical protein SDC9_113519 [bioreactor metagenome]|uniref:Uncharacterized protein n=1 Tax=bioreactor metagenome TaxID=1076179 RepID=A0A645BMA5_9ZZZZ